MGVRFLDVSPEARRDLLLRVIAEPETWADVHAREARSQLGAAAAFVRAIVGFARSHRPSRRRHPRTWRLRKLRLRRGGREQSALLRSSSPLGLGVVCTGSPPAPGAVWRISCLDGPTRLARVVYANRRLRVVWHAGLELIDASGQAVEPEVELAA